LKSGVNALRSRRWHADMLGVALKERPYSSSC
jgi:hypothetical protein